MIRFMTAEHWRPSKYAEDALTKCGRTETSVADHTLQVESMVKDSLAGKRGVSRAGDVCACRMQPAMVHA